MASPHLLADTRRLAHAGRRLNQPFETAVDAFMTAVGNTLAGA